MIPSRGLLVPLLAGLVIIAIGVSDRAKGDWSRDDMNRQIDQTNFVVNSGCSGTLIDLAQRYILTAKHCVTAQYETIEREKISDEGDKPDEALLQVSGGIIGGNSGGAVYNTNGDLIGVPVLGHRINEVIGFAVPVYAIKAFLKASKIEGVLAHCEVAG